MSSLFLQLLQPLPAGVHREISTSDLSELEHLAQRHNLEMLLYTQLKRYFNDQGAVADFLERKKGLYLRNAVHSMHQEAAEREVVSLLKTEGIPACVMKGNEIAREIYKDPNCRTSCDIDILIRKEDILKADACLTDAGYVRNDGFSLTFWLSRIHHALYHHSQRGHFMEVHWNFGIPVFFKLTSEDIWREMVCDESGNVQLSPEMAVIEVLIHHYMHLLGDVKILVDVLWTLHRYESEINWRSLAERLRRMGLAKVTQITLIQLVAEWEMAGREMISVRILQEELERAGPHAPAFLHSYFRMDPDLDHNPGTRKDTFVARLALDRWSTILLFFFRTLIPDSDTVKALYADDRKSALPFHYLRFIQWRLREWTGLSGSK